MVPFRKKPLKLPDESRRLKFSRPCLKSTFSPLTMKALGAKVEYLEIWAVLHTISIAQSFSLNFAVTYDPRACLKNCFIIVVKNIKN